MPRRLIVKQQDIYLHRAAAWARHYENRGLAKNLAEYGVVEIWRVMNAIVKLPSPVLGIDGYIEEDAGRIRGMNDALEYARIGLLNSHLLVSWYWTETDWMDFVRKFNGLPDPQEDYYYRHFARYGVTRLVPMSSKPKWGSGKRADKSNSPVSNSRKSVDNPVDNSVDKYSVFRYKRPVSVSRLKN